MLEFRHIDDNPNDEDRWPFVYLHARAETLAAKFAEDSATDLCLANQKMPQMQVGETLHIPCEVYDEPALCVLHCVAVNSIKGRIALLSDPVGLGHAKCTQDWK
jgi:hypothetical protein